ncbi:MAG TPA: 50S ribosomal protein L25 [Gemmataceae bacterium]|jgi:large subunit ribosomal protein L25|nr:50S ribosomal protein L25 [Gemmataceae bacterium]
MAETVALVAQSRQENGSQAARRLRRKGLVPAILYGHKEATIMLTLNLDEVTKALRHGARVVDLKTEGGKEEKAFIRELQWDHLGKSLLHVDFTRVSLDERITVTVRLELRGIAPGVNAGGVLDQPLHELEIECLAISIPESIRVNIAELQIGAVIYVKDLHLPEGITTTADPEAIVVHVTTPVAEVEPGAIPEAGGTAEPEVIGKTKEEEESES